MKQVSNEKAVFELAVAYRAYENSNPDIGMGWGFDYFIKEAITAFGLETSDVDSSELERIKQESGRKIT
jgi:hypothetical protein